MSVAIVKYNAGNVQSVLFALERLGVRAIWTDDPDELEAASHVIFPGVGEASSAMQYLTEKGMTTVISGLKQPVLGICLGLQLFCRYSEEGNTTCLGIFDADVYKFTPGAGLKVPHMGWNTLDGMIGPLFDGVESGSRCYFVHSYYAHCCAETTATTPYGMPFSAALQRDNFFAVQFHPEKSGATGRRILQNFLKL